MNLKKGLNLAGDVFNFGHRVILSKMNALMIEKKQFGLLINGKIISSAKTFDLINPSTGDIFAQASDAAEKDLKDAISSARMAFDQGPWPKMSLAERAIYLKRVAVAIRKHAKELSDLESVGCGKTIKHSTFIDVPTAADCFEYFGTIFDPLYDRQNKTEASVKSLTSFEPMGVVGCVIPWNYPLIMSAWKMAPALLAGNAVVLKPSSLGCASVLRLAQIINEEASFPQGAVNILATTDHEAAGLMFKSPDVDMISFTGGTSTGREVMRLAAPTTKKLSLELGGKSPNIVFADCNLEAALGGTMSAIFMNQGQMCTAGSRLLVEEKIYEAFISKLVEKTKSLTIGSAMDYQTSFGPVISQGHRDNILGFIERALKDGATLACGGKIPQGERFQKGFFVEPTILTNVSEQSEIAQEEVFGPVLAVMKFKDTEDAIRIANDSKYGLAAMVWTKDFKKADRVAKELRVGTVWINTYGGFYNEASFGGFKQSGSGRTLGIEGLLEFTRSKHICTDQTPGGKPLVTGWF